MSDPFASLDPIQKSKTAAERVLTSPVYNHPPSGAPVAAAPFGGGNMSGHMGGLGMDMGMGGIAPGMSMGMHMNMGPNMGMNGGMGGGNSGMGMMSMGGGAMNSGMNPGMGGMGMGMGQHQPNPFQQQQQQQPVMYDNIKNLLQQKPKAPAGFEDSASMDFLENLGGGGGASGSAFGSVKTNSGSFPSSSNPQVRAASPTSAVIDPFGGGASGFGASPTAVSGDIGLSIFETGGGNVASPSSASSATASTASGGGSKSSALADRLANGRRKTQEMQRSQLQLNANSFAHSGGGGAVPKISLKEMAGQSTSKASTSSEMLLGDFSSGGGSGAFASSKTSSGDFGTSDPFGGGGFSSRSAAPRQSSFGGAQSQEDSGSRPVDENDNTFW